MESGEPSPLWHIALWDGFGALDFAIFSWHFRR